MLDHPPHRSSSFRRAPAGAGRCPSCGRVDRSTLRTWLGRNTRTLGLVTVLVAFGALALAARGLPDYWRNFTQNTAADLAGGALFAYVVGPLTQWQARLWHRDVPPEPDEAPTKALTPE